MRPYILLLVAVQLVREGLELLPELPGPFGPGHHYNLARNLTEERGFVVDYIWQYHRRAAEVTQFSDYWMCLAALWPLNDSSENDGRLPLPGRSSYSRPCGTADA